MNFALVPNWQVKFYLSKYLAVTCFLPSEFTEFHLNWLGRLTLSTVIIWFLLLISLFFFLTFTGFAQFLQPHYERRWNSSITYLKFTRRAIIFHLCLINNKYGMHCKTCNGTQKWCVFFKFLVILAAWLDGSVALWLVLMLLTLSSLPISYDCLNILIFVVILFRIVHLLLLQVGLIVK